MTGPLQGQSVLVVGRAGGIARAVAVAARDAGARVITAGRHPQALADLYAGEPEITAESVDLTDEDSVAALADRIGTLDHVVSTASARARGRLEDLTADAVRLSFDTKVVGPLLLARHLAPRMRQDGSLTLFSGVAASKVTVGTLAVAVTNGAAEVLTRSLAVELAPVRVNAVSPGVIDTGAWDALGDQEKADYFAEVATRNPAGRIGTAHDVANAVL
ncbi:SDR family oxidoreductase, partial [Streptomyces sp. SID5785]|uniref:SDR family oxidoreductase n=1 Tax=Streptomyces sp. SID5785 TaxID=2690309 RepID=UPI0013616AB9